jgi:hypothetical protein
MYSLLVKTTEVQHLNSIGASLLLRYQMRVGEPKLQLIVDLHRIAVIATFAAASILRAIVFEFRIFSYQIQL